MGTKDKRQQEQFKHEANITAFKAAAEIVAAIIASKSGMHVGDMAENPITNVKAMANAFYEDILNKAPQEKEEENG